MTKVENTTSIKNILAPVDFSEESMIGVHTAADLASSIGATLNLLHIIDDFPPDNLRPDGDIQAKIENQEEHEVFITELTKKRKEELKALQDKLNLPNEQVTRFIKYGKYRKELEDYLDDNPIDLIVMGSSGEMSRAEFFTGNHAAQAIRNADIPVLTVKEPYKISEHDKILILIDLKHYQKEKVDKLRNFIETFKLQPHIAHLMKNKDVVEENVEAKLNEFARNNDFKYFSTHIIQDNKFHVDSVKQFSNDYNISIIASISEGAGGLIRLLFGSDTERLLDELQRPLLAISE